MKDSYNQPETLCPPLDTLYFYLAEGCNLKCRHCWINPKYQSTENPGPTLDFELFKQIIEEAKPLGLHTVKLTGGEPMLHPRFTEILDVIHAEGLRFIMETNGLLCNPTIMEKIATLKRPFVSVSMDGADQETHEWIRRVPGSFEQSKQGIAQLVKAGITTQIIMSVMKKNHHQIEAMVRLAEELGVESVKFNLVMPTSRGQKMHEAGETLSIEELIKTGHWVETELAQTTSIRLSYSHPPAFRPLSKHLQGKSGGICGIHNILGVLASGAYALCGVGEHLQELIFGQAGVDSLEKVWQNAPILKELREGIPNRHKGICADCIMKARCFGTCMAQNYYSHRDLWAPFWYCDLADKAGLFPENRKVSTLRSTHTHSL